MRVHRPSYPRLTGVISTVLLAVTMGATSSIAADRPGVAWTQQFGSPYQDDQILDLVVDPEGATYVVGWSPYPLESDPDPTFDEAFGWVFVRKLGPDGEVIWAQEFTVDGVRGVADATDAGIVVGGLGELASWLRRYDADGQLVWQRDVAVERDADTWLEGVAVGPDGSVTVAGDAGPAFVLRYDPGGDLVWTRRFPIRGGAGEVSAVAVDDTGDIYVVGATTGTLGDKHRGGHDAFVRKYDPDGNVMWTRQFGTRKDDVAADVAVDSAGRVVVAGGTYGKLAGKRKGEQDAFVRVLDPDGRTVWTRQFGSKGWEDTNALAVDDAGGIYVVGLTSGRMTGDEKGGSFLRKLEPDGSHAWTTQFGAKERGWTYAVAAHDADRALVGGESQSSSDPSTTDAFVRMYTPDAAASAGDARLAAPDRGAAGSETDRELGSFSQAGRMRDLHDRRGASLLPDGRVLVVNGFGPSGLWDPATSAWGEAGRLLEARAYGHSAAPLTDGRVLVVGGESMETGEPLASAEVWDPSSSSFSSAGSMATPRMEPTLTPLLDGRVLVTAGRDIFGGGDTASAEVWDRGTKSFASAGSFIEPRASHTVTPLPDGRALFVGGLDAPALERILATAEIWDPDTRSFTPAGSLAEARYNHSATALPDGRVLVVGGSSRERPLATAEIWDPATAAFAPAGSLAEARLGHEAMPLPDGRVLVIGGFDARHDVASAEVWDPANASFHPAGSLLVRREAPAYVLLPDGRVFVTGKDVDDDAYASAEVWDPATEAFSRAGSMAKIRWVDSATLLPDGRVLVVGSGDADGAFAEGWAPNATEQDAEPGPSPSRPASSNTSR